jgi:hypothetical protein
MKKKPTKSKKSSHNEQAKNISILTRLFNFIKIFWPFLLTGIFIAFEALAHDITRGDFMRFREAAQNMNIIEFSIFCPNDAGCIHNGRWLVDGFANWVMSQNVKLFVIVTVLMTSLLLYSVARLVKVWKLEFNIIIALAFILVFQFSVFGGGPMPVLINYLWPTAALVYGLTLLTDKNLRIWQNVLRIIAVFYATNHEQFSIVAILIIGGYLVYCIWQKIRINYWVVGALLLAILQLSLLLLSPLEHGRVAIETAAYFPSFSDLSLMRKIDIGFIDTMQHLFVSPFLVIMLMLAVVLVLAIRKKKMIAGAISAFQLAIVLFPQDFEVTQKVNELLKSWHMRDWGQIIQNNGITGTSIHDVGSMLPDVYLVGMSLLFLVAIWQVLDSRKERVIISYILLVGFASRMIMSFSPTIFASGNRTFVPMLTCLFVILIYLLAKILYGDSSRESIKNVKIARQKVQGEV